MTLFHWWIKSSLHRWTRVVPQQCHPGDMGYITFIINEMKQVDDLRSLKFTIYFISKQYFRADSLLFHSTNFARGYRKSITHLRLNMWLSSPVMSHLHNKLDRINFLHWRRYLCELKKHETYLNRFVQTYHSVGLFIKRSQQVSNWMQIKIVIPCLIFLKNIFFLKIRKWHHWEYQPNLSLLRPMWILNNSPRFLFSFRKQKLSQPIPRLPPVHPPIPLPQLAPLLQVWFQVRRSL